ncbi:hypothetical protein RND81_02G136400 [Saponaria officinalis]|uniref:Uncharacterized protein n=1 Tax=Saponaria officinalis TaxID=3572 RepID=A0AAW1MWT2_SAPOF
MGNCYAAEAAETVVVQHPGNGKVEKIYWSVSTNEVMGSNPGYYVALVVESNNNKNIKNVNENNLKLLRPDDTMHIGQVYRLISFEDVLKEFTLKKVGKLKMAGDDQTSGRRRGGDSQQWKPALQSITEF